MAQKETSAYTWLQKQRLRSPQPLILERLAEIPPDQRASTKVLDVPAGNAVISIPLQAAGFDMVACDLFPEHAIKNLQLFRQLGMHTAFRKSCKGFLSERISKKLFGPNSPAIPDNINIVQGDMEQGMPFKDNAFDIILLLEGIEHVDAQYKLIKELRRLLKSGGALFLTTPNTLCLQSRLAYALTGQRTFKSYIDEFTEVRNQSPDKSRLYHGHVFLMNYFQIRYTLHNGGFKIRKLLRFPQSPTSIVLIPLMLPLIALHTWYAQWYAAKKFRHMIQEGRISEKTALPYREMWNHLLSINLLFGNVALFEAEAI